MTNQYVKQAATFCVALSCVALSSIGATDSVVEKKTPTSIADQELFFAPVPKAVCGPGDKPETGLQGQVPAAMRQAGFQGFSCNLQLLAQVRGEGASWQNDEWREGRGKNKKVCAYHGTASETTSASLPGRTNLGTRAIDITDPAKPVTTAYLTTKAMLYPHEALKVNERRQLLATDRGDNGREFDVYDVGGDCRNPQLLSSVVLEPAGGRVAPVAGHEGYFAPDGLTYYVGDITETPTRSIHAVDMTDTTKPKVIASWYMGALDTTPRLFRSHGMSVSDDGNRLYAATSLFTSSVIPDLFDPNSPAFNGFAILDVSDIQARKPNPQVRVISTALFKDGSISQHTIPIHIRGKPYIVNVDEGGSGGNFSPSLLQFELACAAGRAPFPMARIYDISDEKNPKVVSKLMLEIHDTANCDKVRPDLAGLSSFIYGSHYCSVDNRSNTTTLVCGYLNSGIRVFDIRDPVRPREIAYYNPAGTTTASPGSNHATWVAGGPDWCPSQLHLDSEQGTLWTTCVDNGLLSLKFTHDAWPFAEARTPTGRQN